MRRAALFGGKTKPGALVNVSATTPGSTLSLSWEAPTTGGAPEYYEGRTEKNMPIGSGIGWVFYGKVFTRTQNISLNSTYYYQIRAVNSAGTGPISSGSVES